MGFNVKIIYLTIKYIITHKDDSIVINAIEHPPPVTILPIFCALPLLDKGIPILREIFCFTLVMPIKRFQENPPRFILPPILVYYFFQPIIIKM